MGRFFETYVALKLLVEDWRWQDVPFFTLQRLVKIKVVQTAARPKGGYSIVGRLITPLSDEDLKALRS